VQPFFFGDSLNSVRSDGDSFLIFIDFFGDTNGNFFGIKSKPVLTGGRKLRVNQSAIDHEGFLIIICNNFQKKDISFLGFVIFTLQKGLENFIIFIYFYLFSAARFTEEVL